MKDRQKELEANAEYQRRRMMTKDERAIDSRDRVAVNLHRQNEKDGKNTTFADALKKATEVAHRRLREEQEKK